jgi:ABC-type glycerol-3-phosphate transport system substrate-binding protein
MTLRLLLPVCAAALLALAACGGMGDEPPVTDTPTPSPGAAPAQVTPTPSPTATVQTYRNDRYGYEVAIPTGWRVATVYMDAFAEVLSYPGMAAVTDDYVLLTSLTEGEELAAVEQAFETVAIGLSPWFGFAEGNAVHISPLGALFPGISMDE